MKKLLLILLLTSLTNCLVSGGQITKCIKLCGENNGIVYMERTGFGFSTTDCVCIDGTNHWLKFRE